MPYTAEEFRERRLKREEESEKKASENEKKAKFISTLMIIGAFLIFWLFIDMSATALGILFIVFILFRIENQLCKLIEFAKRDKEN